jgi:hypothetical protein
MIIFLSDWDYFPSAIADFQTTNKSFLHLAQLYESMGIKNNVFHLSLLNPSLQGVDPFSPHLTVAQKIDIGFECSQNPWYFFREVLRVPPQSGPNPVRLRANRGNIGLYWSFFNHIDAALIQPRQTGKSVSTDGLMTNITYMSTDNTTTTMITKDNVLRCKNVERLKRIRDLLPPYLIQLSRDDADNQVELTYKRRMNSYMTAVAQNSAAGAENVGRGLTAPILHNDEGPFCSFINITLPAALAAGTAARNEARANGRPYGNIFTTTAGKKDTREGRFMYDLIHGGAPWDERMMFDSRDEADLRDRVLKNCAGVEGKKGVKRALVNITLSHKQLGETDEWLMEAIANAGGTPDSIERDFLNRWTSGSLRSPLSTELNERILNSVKRADHLEFSTDNYCLNWYIPENEVAQRMSEGRFVAGLDTSEAVGRDTIALVIIDIENLSVVATGTYNETNLIRFSHYLGSVLIKYTNITLVPERKSTGAMIVDYLILQLIRAGQDPFKRIFNSIVDDAMVKKEEFQEVMQRPLPLRTEHFYDSRKASFGFKTNADSRTLLYTTILQNAAKNGGHVVNSESLSSEIRGLVVKNDRIDHTASGHDDHVIAWLLAHWLLSHGRNLINYGIDTTRVMSALAHFNESEETPAAAYQRSHQQRLLQEASALIEQLSAEQDAWVLAKLEGRLRSLSGRLVDDDDTSYIQSIDAAIAESRENREKLKRLQGRQGLGYGSNSMYRGLDRSVAFNQLPISRPGHLITYV